MRAHTFVSCGCGGGYVDGVACVDDVERGVKWRVAQAVSAVQRRCGMCWFVYTNALLLSFVARLQHVARAWLCCFALTRVCFAMHAHTFVSCGCGGGYVDGVAYVDDVGRGSEWRVTQTVSAVLWRCVLQSAVV
jgi:hypothetical protein